MYFNIVEYPSCQRTIRIESTQSAWHIISREAIFQAWLIKSIFCRQNIIMLSESHIYRFSLYPGKKFPLQTCIRFSPVVLFLSISVRSIFARARLLYGICSSPVFAAFIRIFLRFAVGSIADKTRFFWIILKPILYIAMIRISIKILYVKTCCKTAQRNLLAAVTKFYPKRLILC